MAYVLADIIGKPGAIIVNIGVIIAIFGAWMANTMLAEEVVKAGKQQLFPKIFTRKISGNARQFNLYYKFDCSRDAV